MANVGHISAKVSGYLLKAKAHALSSVMNPSFKHKQLLHLFPCFVECASHLIGTLVAVIVSYSSLCCQISGRRRRWLQRKSRSMRWTGCDGMSTSIHMSANLAEGSHWTRWARPCLA